MDDVDTAPPSLQGESPPPEDAPPSPPRRPRWLRVLGWSALTFLVILVASVVAASTFTVPYYAIEPGSARPVNDLLNVPADKLHPPGGKVLLVTVGVQHLTALGYIQAKLSPDDEVLSAKDYLGDQTDKQVNQQARQEMVDSQMFAAVAAFRRLGNDVTEQGEGATLQQVDPNTPAAGHLHVGDLITVANGKPVKTAQDLRSTIQALKPGDLLNVTVTGPERSATPRTETIKLGARPEPDRANVAFLGVVFVTHNQKFDTPFPVRIDTGSIGGPSAGLAFTLGLIDDLSPGELTGGKKIAATGTIDPTGIVGPIGGAAQKTVAVLRQHADVFLVPADRSDYCPALAKAKGKMKVIPVRNLEDAVNALRSLGGDTSVLPPSPATLVQSNEAIPDCSMPAAHAAGK